MAIKNPRINVTFEKAVVQILDHLAHQEHKSLASLVRELTLESLDKREDFHLSKLAAALDKKDAETYNHEDTWE